MPLGAALDQKAFDGAAGFVWRHARLLERRLFQAAFGAGGSVASPEVPSESAASALAARALAGLLAYQNPDGGFGHALEPDIRCPDSQPVAVEVALRAIGRIGSVPEAAMRSACDWLATVTTAEGGVPFSLPTLNAYPHAPWWEAPEDPPASLNPTAAIVGLLHRHGIRHAWLTRATAYCYERIAAWDGTDFHTAMPVVTFLEHAPDRGFAGRELARLRDRLHGAIETDPDAEGYTHLPLDWAPRPESPLRNLFGDAMLRRHLEALRDRQQEDGGWPIAWPTVSETVTYEWRGVRTLDALETLRAYA